MRHIRSLRKITSQNGLRVIIFLLLFSSLATDAAVFGDSNHLNGVEDQRVTRKELDEWPKEFKSVGRIYCDGVMQGSAVLFKQKAATVASPPRLLTAAHVIENFDVSRCSFSEGSSSWVRKPISSIVFRGELENSLSIVSRYQADWVVLALDVEKSWSVLAIELSPESLSSLQRQQGMAYMVSFDVVRDQMVVHAGCHFGLAEQSDLLGPDARDLYWDDCDSTQGSSGGALFVATENGYQLAGIRVGSLFDEVITGGEPEMGAEFDIDANINVSRAVSGEMLESGSSDNRYAENH